MALTVRSRLLSVFGISLREVLVPSLIAVAIGWIFRRGFAMFWWPKSRVSQLDQPAPDFKKLKEVSQVLVIDDDPKAFPVGLLQSEGYKITHWLKVENLALIESGSFDLVVLDIAGVAKAWSDTEADGLAILRMIKKGNPGQYVISFSGQKAIHELGDFWKLSDAQLKKPVSAEDCKLALDEGIRSRVGISQYWGRIAEALRTAGVTSKQIATIEKQIVFQARRGDKTDNVLKSLLQRFSASEKTQDLIVTLAVKLVAAATTKA